MGSSIGEPFLLSSYAVHQQIGSAKETEGSTSSVYASHSEWSTNDGLVTVTAQGDGVHIVDLANLNPVASHTLGPSTTFSCPAVSRVASQDSRSVCTTYAAIQASTDIPSDRRESTIWLWEEDMASSAGGSRQKQELIITHPVCQLYTADEIDGSALALSPKGAISVVSKGGKTISREAPLGGGSDVFKTFIHPRRVCTFLNAHSSPSNGAIVASLSVLSDQIQLSVLACNDSSITEVGTHTMPLEKEGLLDASLSPSGVLTLLYQDGFWYSYQLELTGDISINSYSLAQPLPLASLSFVASAISRPEVSLLSLGSSYALVAGITTSPREIVLLLWDLQYSILLASHTLPIPSTLSQSKDVTIRLGLSLAKNHILLTLCPLTHSRRKSLNGASSLRSSIFAIPFAVPPTSTIASALGHTVSSARWLRPAQLPTVESNTEKARLLALMRVAIEQGRPNAASDAFFEWKNKQAASSNDSTNSEVFLPYDFVKDLLSVIFQTSKAANSLYSSEVIKYLLEQEAISTNMLEGGLLGHLRLKADWASIDMALRTVTDLSEAELTVCLGNVVSQSQEPAPDAEAMQVDSLQNCPPLPAFLAAFIQYPMTATTLRLSLRENFTNEEDICSVLKVIESWLRRWNQSNATLGLSEHLVDALGLPPLDKILGFLQVLIDATFISLLQHQPSHPILQNIMSDIELQMTFIDDLGALRGPLEAFAKATQETKDGKGKAVSQTEWMRKRKHAHEQTGVAVGLYRLEELVI